MPGLHINMIAVNCGPFSVPEPRKTSNWFKDVSCGGFERGQGTWKPSSDKVEQRPPSESMRQRRLRQANVSMRMKEELLRRLPQRGGRRLPHAKGHVSEMCTGRGGKESPDSGVACCRSATVTHSIMLPILTDMDP